MAISHTITAHQPTGYVVLSAIVTIKHLIRQVVVTRVISLMYNQQLVPKKNSSGPVYNALLTFKRYGVLQKVDELLMTMSQGMSMVKWKLFVNKLVIEEVTMTWNTQRYMYRSLKLYN